MSVKYHYMIGLWAISNKIVIKEAGELKVSFNSLSDWINTNQLD